METPFDFFARPEAPALASALAAVGDAVVACDPAGQVRFMNAAAEALTGCAAAAAAGRPVAEVVRVAEEGDGRGILTASDGTTHPVDLGSAPIRNDAGDAVGFVLVFRDAAARAEADRRHEEFPAVVAHELRNPLAAISNALAVLKRADPGGEDAARMRELMERNVAQLARLLAGLLDRTPPPGS